MIVSSSGAAGWAAVGAVSAGGGVMATSSSGSPDVAGSETRGLSRFEDTICFLCDV